MGPRAALTPALALVTSTASAETPRFTVGCDHDGFTCQDGFPALAGDRQTIANVVYRDATLVVEFVSLATSKVLRRQLAFDPRERAQQTLDRIAKLHRELRGFRTMALVEQGDDDVWLFRLGTVELAIAYCEREDCRTTYRVRRRRR